MKKDINGFVKTHSSVLAETVKYGCQDTILVYNKKRKIWKKVSKLFAFEVINSVDTFFQVWADDDVIKIA